MGRPDPAGREDIVELGPAFIDRRDDFFADIGNNPRFAHLDADFIQTGGEKIEILVLGATRQDFVSDQDQARSNGVFVSHEFFRFFLPPVYPRPATVESIRSGS